MTKTQLTQSIRCGVELIPFVCVEFTILTYTCKVHHYFFIFLYFISYSHFHSLYHMVTFFNVLDMCPFVWLDTYKYTFCMCVLTYIMALWYRRYSVSYLWDNIMPLRFTHVVLCASNVLLLWCASAIFSSWFHSVTSNFSL